MNDLHERYKDLIARDDRALHAEELETLASRLGRKLEARGWSQVHRGIAGRLPLFLDEDRADAGRTSAGTLEMRLADLLARPAAPASGARPEVRPSRVTFSSDAETAGLRFVHDNGHSGKRTRPRPRRCAAASACSTSTATAGSTSMSSREGHSRPPAWPRRKGATACSAIAATEPSRMSPAKSGIAAMPRGYGHGVAVGDYDNDGHPDLFVTRWRSYALYRNRGDGTFEDVDPPGRPGRRPRLADLGGLRRPRRRRRPGPLRLPLPRARTPSNPKRCEHPDAPSRHECNPHDFPSLPDHVFRNDGGRFVDVTAEAGIVDPDGRGLGRRRRRPRRRRPDRPVRRQRHDGQLPVPQPGRLPVRGIRTDVGGRRRQRRRGIQGRDGRRLRRPRRRRPARPGRHQLLRRVDHLLPQPGRRLLRRQVECRSA